MRILYLTYDGLSDPLGQSQILPYLEGLSQHGHEIIVISFEKKTLPETFRSDLRIIPLRYHKSPPVLSTVYDLVLLKKEIAKILQSEKIDIVHCRSYITSLAGLWAKRKYGVRFIFDMRGFWADERVEGKLWNLNNPFYSWVYRYFKQKEKIFIHEADAIISLTYNAKEEITEQFFSDEPLLQADSKIAVIPTCADLDLFRNNILPEAGKKVFREQLGIKTEDFVLLYLGSLGTWYMLDEMLDFFEVLKAERAKQYKQRVRFLFLSKDETILAGALRNRSYENDEIIITSATRQGVPKYISICNASVFFITPTFSKKASCATKMGEIMAMGKPVITNAGWGDIEKILGNNNGIIIREFNEEAYQEGVRAVDIISGYEQDIIKTAKEIFSLINGVEKYHQVYMQLGHEFT